MDMERHALKFGSFVALGHFVHAVYKILSASRYITKYLVKVVTEETFKMYLY